MWIGHRKEIWKLTFRALAIRRSESNWISLRRRANARNQIILHIARSRTGLAIVTSHVFLGHLSILTKKEIKTKQMYALIYFKKYHGYNNIYDKQSTRLNK